MNPIRRLTMLVAVASICCALSAQEDIPRRDVPAAVLAAYDKAYPGAMVLEWDKEIHSGKLYYEAETRRQGAA